MKPVIAIAFFAFFPLIFVAMWIFVCLVISLMGWRSLARHFLALNRPTGQNFLMQSAVIGGSQYQGCLSIIVAESGLYLRPWLLFRAFHPPILIPWSAFSSPKTEKIWWATQWTTQVQTPDRQRIKISSSSPIGQIIAARVAALEAEPQASLPTSPWSSSPQERPF